MRMVDIKCECEADAAGVLTLVISAKGLSIEEAQAISDRMQEPFRVIVNDVLSEGGTVPLERRDLMEKPQ
jgi:hypothetical protein